MERDDENRKLEKMLELNPELRASYADSYFIAPGKTTLCPAEVFEPRYKDLIQSYNYTLSDDEELHHHYFRKLDAYAIFAVNQKHYHHYAARLPGLQTIPADAAMATALSVEPVINKPAYMHTDINEDYITVVVFKGGKLNLMNTFNCSNDQDVLYYILFTARQLGFDPGKDHFTFSGAIEKGSPLFRILYQYIQNPVLVSDSRSRQELRTKTGRYLFQRYFQLLSILSCE